MCAVFGFVLLFDLKLLQIEMFAGNGLRKIHQFFAEKYEKRFTNFPNGFLEEGIGNQSEFQQKAAEICADLGRWRRPA